MQEYRYDDLYQLAERAGNYGYKVDEAGVITANFASSSDPAEVRRNGGF